MYIVNPESLNQSDLFYCHNKQLKDYLIGKGFMYVSKKYDEKNKSVTWVFSKTKELMDELQKY